MKECPPTPLECPGAAYHVACRTGAGYLWGRHDSWFTGTLLLQAVWLVAKGPDEGLQQGAVLRLLQPVSGSQLLDAV